MKYFFLFFGIILSYSLSSQVLMTHCDENGIQYVEEFNRTYNPILRNDKTVSQMAGYPKIFPANSTFKNFRGVSLADIDNDSSHEILVGIKNQFLVFKADSLMWTIQGQGTFIYPPTIGDLDNDGDLEVVQVTGGFPSSGYVYAWDHHGNDLTGWPRTFDEHWILTTATFDDLNDDLMKEIILLERDSPSGRVHIIKYDGKNFGGGWPVALPGTPAITPSVGDIDNDGLKDIVVSTSTSLYALDLAGNIKPGWPIENPATKFSFQSTVLVDVDSDDDLEIIGSSHGISPEFYMYHHDGLPANGWPIPVPEMSWTFSPPTVVSIENKLNIFMARPAIDDSIKNIFYGWDQFGSELLNFPLQKEGGNEGFISVADINNDDQFEVLFSSNVIEGQSGLGYIHAFDISTGLEMEGFPLRPRGWTYMNGANLGDVNGDGMLDLVALSYTQKFGEIPDSTIINVFELNYTYIPENILWGTYKGSNERTGLKITNTTTQNKKSTFETPIFYPNPSDGNISQNLGKGLLNVYDVRGMLIDHRAIDNHIKLENLQGVFILQFIQESNIYVQKIVITK